MRADGANGDAPIGGGWTFACESDIGDAPVGGGWTFACERDMPGDMDLATHHPLVFCEQVSHVALCSALKDV